MNRSPLLLAMLFTPLLLGAEVYRWTDAQGTVHFGDAPNDSSAESVELRQPSIYSAPAPYVSSQSDRRDLDEAVAPNYRINLVSPTQEQSFRDALGVIPVSAQVQPLPKTPVIYRFLLDGQTVAESSQASTQLEGIHRGSHQIQVVLLDDQGQPLASSPIVTFYLHKPIAKPKPR